MCNTLTYELYFTRDGSKLRDKTKYKLCSGKQIQQALLLQRDRVTRLWVKSCNYDTFHLKKKIKSNKWPWSNLTPIIRSSQLLLDRPYITFCYWFVVTMSLSSTTFEILPHLKWTWLPVTLRTFSLLTIKLSYKPCALSNLCVNIS